MKILTPRLILSDYLFLAAIFCLLFLASGLYGWTLALNRRTQAACHLLQMPSFAKLPIRASAKP